MNEDELKRLYQEGMKRPGLIPQSAPEPELLLRVARGEADEAERLRVMDAVMQSDELRREYDTFRALAAAAKQEPGNSSRRVPWRPLLAAAALLTFVATGSVLWQRRAGEEPWRGGREPLTLVSPRPDATVRGSVTLTWRPAAGATGYAVELLDDAGKTVLQQSTSDTSLVLPDSLALGPGHVYRWGVTVRRDDGSTARSSYSAFRLAR